MSGVYSAWHAWYSDLMTTPIGYEALCACGETFNPDDETDLTHLVREDGTECGLEGEMTGEWK